MEGFKENVEALFSKVISILEQRAQVRGDSYLEWSYDEIASLLMTKSRRFKGHGKKLDDGILLNEAQLTELLDAIFDSIGWAALAFDKLRKDKYVGEIKE